MKMLLIVIGIIYGISLIAMPLIFSDCKEIDKDSDLLD